MLIVVSNGYSFLDSSTGLVNKEKQIELQKWESRALVTPVPSADWSDGEKALAKCFAVVPADLQGWELVLQAIDGSARPAQLAREYHTYSCTGIDFEDIGQLRAYLDDEDVFQWVCAAAIYHHIRWELTIEIGRRVLADNNALHKLNYTNLLKLYRVSWMKDAIIPPALRVKLLAHLNTKNEVSARKVMLKMLEYSDGLLKENSVAFKEKAMETYVNRFILYANAPTRFSAFEDDKDVFLSLWQKGRIGDKSLEIYLKNEQQQWSTPILSAVDNITTVKIDEYVNQKSNTNESYFSVERCIQILLCFLVNFLLLQIIVHNSAKDLLLSGINKKYNLIENPNLKEEIRVDIKADTLFDNLVKQNGINKLKVTYYGIDGARTNAKADGPTRFSKVDGSSEEDFRCYNFTFPNVDFYKGYYKSGKIEVEFLNKKFVAKVPLNCAQYLITFKQPACEPPPK